MSCDTFLPLGAYEYHFISHFDPFNSSYIYKCHIHTYGTYNRDLYALDQYMNPARHAPCKSITIANGDNSNYFI